MSDDEAPQVEDGTPHHRQSDRLDDPLQRIHSDVARLVDVDRLRDDVMATVRANTEAVSQVGVRVDGLRDDFGRYIQDHAQLHASESRDLADRWDGIADLLAAQRGFVGVLHILNKYRAPLLWLLALLGAMVGFVTGAVDVRVGQ